MAHGTAYHNAERKIEDALHNQATELDLSLDHDTEDSLRLTELPESLFRLTWLERLDLSENRLTTVPASVSRLTQLRVLDLSGNRLTVLPESLSRLTRLEWLHLSWNRLTTLPESLSRLTRLEFLDLSENQLTTVPESLSRLTQLELLSLSRNRLTALPESLIQLTQLQALFLSGNRLTTLPESLSRLTQLELLHLSKNQLTALPASLGRLDKLEIFMAESNQFHPELAAAVSEGWDAVKQYLRAQAAAQIELNEAKLILIGEGEVGKTCLLGALRGDPWEEGRPTTHGIEIKPVQVTDPETGTEIRLNGWDFGGQRVYRPTHQLFFSAPAVYLVVWKPREGPQQGFVKEWIELIRRRAPEARILVVATHGGPKERQPNIDRQAFWDRFGRETVIEFFHIDSRPDPETQACRGIAELKQEIARVAAGLPEMGRAFPEHWQAVREQLRASREAYLPLERVFGLCGEQGIGREDARLLLRICHRLGDLIHYEHDPTLRDLVILKPDWLATAISFVLDDEQTRKQTQGLISFARLGQLWKDPDRPAEDRYPTSLHPIFLRLMERFDLSYRVADETEDTSLIGQLVPDVRSELGPHWPPDPAAGDEQQLQICRILDTAKNQSATAEGLFYQLIVRLHRYSLGRADHRASVHWQRGLLLEDDMGARAFLEHMGDDVRIRVRSPYPERFLAALTYEVKWLVESFWKGLRCEVTVPCLTIREDGQPCKGLFEVGQLIENKGRHRPEQPCQVCNEWQNIEQLLHNAPAARPNPLEELLANSGEIMLMLQAIHRQQGAQQARIMGRFDHLDKAGRELLSKVEDGYAGLMRTLVDEAKEGPRLFSLEPVEPGFWDRPKWVSARFRVTLWCEHSRLPLPVLNGKDSKQGVYDLDLPRQWLVKSAPFLKLLTGTLGLVVPVAASATKLVLDEAAYKAIEGQLDLGQKTFEAVLKIGERITDWPEHSDAPDPEQGEAIAARGPVLRQLQTWLKAQDPGFGGLVRVQNKRQEFLWVHPQFEIEY
ncbi:COR domain-containing protein [Candidatus Thiosymbion oneisti]|uniref:COR domain-containing protein n=1 Tax=Candidatus Thiosymbion oneisti TaxID=589554 RepID=UPI000ABC77BC|nr:COR domain-containing protein [Candidatus Thiosymbion oneisti]